MPSNIEIETSSDTVEEVKEALGSSIEIEESPAAEEPPAEGEGESELSEEGAEEGAGTEEEEEPEEGASSKEKEEGQPKAKPGKKEVPMVPLARLNEEIKRRKRAEQRAAAHTDEPEEEEPQESREAEPPAEKRPQFFSGKPEPQLDAFMKGVDELDSKAVAKATADFSKAYSDWSREEARAEAVYNVQVEQAREAWLELTEPFIERRDAFVAQYPEYNGIVGKSQVNLTREQQEFVYESEAGPQILWYFTEHPRQNRHIQSLGKREWSKAMLEIEAKALEKWPLKAEEEAEEEPPPAKRAQTLTPKPKSSKAPEPPNRIKGHTPGPKSEAELAGPQDRTGVDIDFSPELERRDKARRSAT